MTDAERMTRNDPVLRAFRRDVLHVFGSDKCPPRDEIAPHDCPDCTRDEIGLAARPLELVDADESLRRYHGEVEPGCQRLLAHWEARWIRDPTAR